MKLFCLFTLIAPVFCAGSDDEHAHHNSCACEAKCSTDCSFAASNKNFLIVQSHHDFCLLDEVVPSPVENSFHDFEAVCEHCAISRKRDPDLSNCPVCVCDNRGDEAYRALLTEGCVNNGNEVAAVHVGSAIAGNSGAHRFPFIFRVLQF
jgi:hypothetical protein